MKPVSNVKKLPDSNVLAFLRPARSILTGPFTYLVCIVVFIAVGFYFVGGNKTYPSSKVLPDLVDVRLDRSVHFTNFENTDSVLNPDSTVLYVSRKSNGILEVDSSSFFMDDLIPGPFLNDEYDDFVQDISWSNSGLLALGNESGRVSLYRDKRWIEIIGGGQLPGLSSKSLKKAIGVGSEIYLLLEDPKSWGVYHVVDRRLSTLELIPNLGPFEFVEDFEINQNGEGLLLTSTSNDSESNFGFWKFKRVGKNIVRTNRDVFGGALGYPEKVVKTEGSLLVLTSEGALVRIVDIDKPEADEILTGGFMPSAINLSLVNWIGVNPAKNGIWCIQENGVIAKYLTSSRSWKYFESESTFKNLINHCEPVMQDSESSLFLVCDDFELHKVSEDSKLPVTDLKHQIIPIVDQSREILKFGPLSDSDKSWVLVRNEDSNFGIVHESLYFVNLSTDLTANDRLFLTNPERLWSYPDTDTKKLKFNWVGAFKSRVNSEVINLVSDSGTVYPYNIEKKYLGIGSAREQIQLPPDTKIQSILDMDGSHVWFSLSDSSVHFHDFTSDEFILEKMWPRVTGEKPFLDVSQDIELIGIDPETQYFVSGNGNNLSAYNRSMGYFSNLYDFNFSSVKKIGPSSVIAKNTSQGEFQVFSTNDKSNGPLTDQSIEVSRFASVFESPYGFGFKDKGEYDFGYFLNTDSGLKLRRRVPSVSGTGVGNKISRIENGPPGSIYLCDEFGILRYDYQNKVYLRLVSQTGEENWDYIGSVDSAYAFYSSISKKVFVLNGDTSLSLPKVISPKILGRNLVFIKDAVVCWTNISDLFMDHSVNLNKTITYESLSNLKPGLDLSRESVSDISISPNGIWVLANNGKLYQYSEVSGADQYSLPQRFASIHGTKNTLLGVNDSGDVFWNQIASIDKQSWIRLDLKTSEGNTVQVAEVVSDYKSSSFLIRSEKNGLWSVSASGEIKVIAGGMAAKSFKNIEYSYCDVSGIWLVDENSRLLRWDSARKGLLEKSSSLGEFKSWIPRSGVKPLAIASTSGVYEIDDDSVARISSREFASIGDMPSEGLIGSDANNSWYYISEFKQYGTRSENQNGLPSNVLGIDNGFLLKFDNVVSHLRFDSLSNGLVDIKETSPGAELFEYNRRLSFIYDKEDLYSFDTKNGLQNVANGISDFDSTMSKAVYLKNDGSIKINNGNSWYTLLSERSFNATPVALREVAGNPYDSSQMFLLDKSNDLYLYDGNSRSSKIVQKNVSHIVPTNSGLVLKKEQSQLVDFQTLEISRIDVPSEFEVGPEGDICGIRSNVVWDYTNSGVQAVWGDYSVRWPSKINGFHVTDNGQGVFLPLENLGRLEIYQYDVLSRSLSRVKPEVFSFNTKSDILGIYSDSGGAVSGVVEKSYNRGNSFVLTASSGKKINLLNDLSLPVIYQGGYLFIDDNRDLIKTNHSFDRESLLFGRSIQAIGDHYWSYDLTNGTRIHRIGDSLLLGKNNFAPQSFEIPNGIEFHPVSLFENESYSYLLNDDLKSMFIFDSNGKMQFHNFGTECIGLNSQNIFFKNDREILTAGLQDFDANNLKPIYRAVKGSKSFIKAKTNIIGDFEFVFTADNQLYYRNLVDPNNLYQSLYVDEDFSTISVSSDGTLEGIRNFSLIEPEFISDVTQKLEGGDFQGVTIADIEDKVNGDIVTSETLSERGLAIKKFDNKWCLVYELDETSKSKKKKPSDSFVETFNKPIAFISDSEFDRLVEIDFSFELISLSYDRYPGFVALYYDQSLGPVLSNENLRLFLSGKFLDVFHYDKSLIGLSAVTSGDSILIFDRLNDKSGFVGLSESNLVESAVFESEYLTLTLKGHPGYAWKFNGEIWERFSIFNNNEVPEAELGEPITNFEITTDGLNTLDICGDGEWIYDFAFRRFKRFVFEEVYQDSDNKIVFRSADDRWWNVNGEVLLDFKKTDAGDEVVIKRGDWEWVHVDNTLKFKYRDWGKEYFSINSVGGLMPGFELPYQAMKHKDQLFVRTESNVWIVDNDRRIPVASNLSKNDRLSWFKNTNGVYSVSFEKNGDVYTWNSANFEISSLLGEIVYRFTNDVISLNEIVVEIDESEIDANIDLSAKYKSGFSKQIEFLGDCFSHELIKNVDAVDSGFVFKTGTGFVWKYSDINGFILESLVPPDTDQIKTNVYAEPESNLFFNKVGDVFELTCSVGNPGSATDFSIPFSNGAFSYQYPELFSLNNSLLAGVVENRVFLRSFNTPEDIRFLEPVSKAFGNIADVKITADNEIYVVNDSGACFFFDLQNGWIEALPNNPFNKKILNHQCSDRSVFRQDFVGENLTFINGLGNAEDDNFKFDSSKGNFSNFILAKQEFSESMKIDGDNIYWFSDAGIRSSKNKSDYSFPVSAENYTANNIKDHSGNSRFVVREDFLNNTKMLLVKESGTLLETEASLKDGLMPFHQFQALSVSDSAMFILNSEDVVCAQDITQTFDIVNFKPIVGPDSMNVPSLELRNGVEFCDTMEKCMVRLNGSDTCFLLVNQQEYKSIGIEDFSQTANEYAVNMGENDFFSWLRLGSGVEFSLKTSEGFKHTPKVIDGVFSFDSPSSVRPLKTGLLLEVDAGQGTSILIIEDYQQSCRFQKIGDSYNESLLISNGYQISDNAKLRLMLKNEGVNQFIEEGDSFGTCRLVAAVDKDLIEGSEVLAYPYKVSRESSILNITWPDGWVGRIDLFNRNRNEERIYYEHDHLNGVYFIEGDEAEEDVFVCPSYSGVVLRSAETFGWIDGFESTVGINYSTIKENKNGEWVVYDQENGQWIGNDLEPVSDLKSIERELANFGEVNIYEDASGFGFTRTDSFGNTLKLESSTGDILPLDWDRTSLIIPENSTNVMVSPGYWYRFSEKTADQAFVGEHFPELKNSLQIFRPNHMKGTYRLLVNGSVEVGFDSGDLRVHEPTIWADRSILLHPDLSGKSFVSDSSVSSDVFNKISGPAFNEGSSSKLFTYNEAVVLDHSGFGYDNIFDHAVFEDILFAVNEFGVEKAALASVDAVEENSFVRLPAINGVSGSSDGFEFFIAENSSSESLNLFMESNENIFVFNQSANAFNPFSENFNSLMASWDSGSLLKTKSGLVFNDSSVGISDAVSNEQKELLFSNDKFSWDDISILEKDYLKSSYEYPQKFDGQKFVVMDSSVPEGTWGANSGIEFEIGKFIVSTDDTDSSYLNLNGVKLRKGFVGTKYHRASDNKLWIVDSDSIDWLKLESRWLDRFIDE